VEFHLAEQLYCIAVNFQLNRVYSIGTNLDTLVVVVPGNKRPLHNTVIFFLLHNYEMKEEIYCFVIFMIAKYEQFYVITRRNNASHQILSSQTKIIKTT
jgi:NAD/NADP transhydrogenase alpha subunit